MNRTCIQCGKEFELNESEVSFYEGKGLELPKRCKECRKENKKNRSRRNHSRKNGQNRKDTEKSANTVKQENQKTEQAAKQSSVRVSSVEALTEPDKPETFFQKLKKFFGIG